MSTLCYPLLVTLVQDVAIRMTILKQWPTILGKVYWQSLGLLNSKMQYASLETASI